jgi:hypothetical protein
VKALSVWEPWASLLAYGVKAYETRSWSPPIDCYRVPIAIHAGKSLAGMEVLMRDANLLKVCDQRLGWGHPYAFGSVIAVGMIAFVLDTDGPVGREVLATERLLGDWAPGRYAWRLTDVRLLRHPVPCVGRQKVWTLPAPVAQVIEAEL